eukprot:SAG22_NODE_110_length_19679_cov_45.046527_21_plen_136_part_00
MMERAAGLVPCAAAHSEGAGRLAGAGARGGVGSLRCGSTRASACLPAPERATRFTSCVVARGGHCPADWDVSPTVGVTAANVAPRAGPTHPTVAPTGSGTGRVLVLPHFLFRPLSGTLCVLFGSASSGAELGWLS